MRAFESLSSHFAKIENIDPQYSCAGVLFGLACLAGATIFFKNINRRK